MKAEFEKFVGFVLFVYLEDNCSRKRIMSEQFQLLDYCDAHIATNYGIPNYLYVPPHSMGGTELRELLGIYEDIREFENQYETRQRFVGLRDSLHWNEFEGFLDRRKFEHMFGHYSSPDQCFITGVRPNYFQTSYRLYLRWIKQNIQNEEWRFCRALTRDYQVSSLGRVRKVMKKFCRRKFLVPSHKYLEQWLQSGKRLRDYKPIGLGPFDSRLDWKEVESTEIQWQLLPVRTGSKVMQFEVLCSSGLTAEGVKKEKDGRNYFLGGSRARGHRRNILEKPDFLTLCTFNYLAAGKYSNENAYRPNLSLDFSNRKAAALQEYEDAKRKYALGELEGGFTELQKIRDGVALELSNLNAPTGDLVPLHLEANGWDCSIDKLRWIDKSEANSALAQILYGQDLDIGESYCSKNKVLPSSQMMTLIEHLEHFEEYGTVTIGPTKRNCSTCSEIATVMDVSASLVSKLLSKVREESQVRREQQELILGTAGKELNCRLWELFEGGPISELNAAGKGKILGDVVFLSSASATADLRSADLREEGDEEGSGVYKNVPEVPVMDSINVDCSMKGVDLSYRNLRSYVMYCRKWRLNKKAIADKLSSLFELRYSLEQDRVLQEVLDSVDREIRSVGGKIKEASQDPRYSEKEVAVDINPTAEQMEQYMKEQAKARGLA